MISWDTLRMSREDELLDQLDALRREYEKRSEPLKLELAQLQRPKVTPLLAVALGVLLIAATIGIGATVVHWLR